MAHLLVYTRRCLAPIASVPDSKRAASGISGRLQAGVWPARALALARKASSSHPLPPGSRRTRAAPPHPLELLRGGLAAPLRIFLAFPRDPPRSASQFWPAPIPHAGPHSLPKIEISDQAAQSTGSIRQSASRFNHNSRSVLGGAGFVPYIPFQRCEKSIGAHLSEFT